MFRQVREPRRDPARHREHPGADYSQDVRPLSLNGAGFDQLAPQLRRFDLGEIGLRGGEPPKPCIDAGP